MEGCVRVISGQLGHPKALALLSCGAVMIGFGLIASTGQNGQVCLCGAVLFSSSQSLP
jgi:hypothetical protein